jgi:hypothetical protein
MTIAAKDLTAAAHCPPRDVPKDANYVFQGSHSGVATNTGPKADTATFTCTLYIDDHHNITTKDQILLPPGQSHTFNRQSQLNAALPAGSYTLRAVTNMLGATGTNHVADTCSFKVT